MSGRRSDRDAINWRDGGAATSARAPRGRSSGGRGRGNGSWRRAQNAEPNRTNAHRGARQQRRDPPPSRAAAEVPSPSHNESAAAVDDAVVTDRHAAAVAGSCAHMCPRAEVHERTRTKEISRFERPAPHMRSSQQDVFSLAVKKYRRPAAGRIDIDPAQLRPPRVLLQTLEHLFTDVLLWPGCGFDWQSPNPDAKPCGKATPSEPSEFLALYHFISDRVRSVRQDLTVQRIEDVVAVGAMEQIVRFYALASLRARQVLPPQPSGHEHAEWSEKLNDQQLASALAQLQVLYRKNDLNEGDDDTSESQSEFAAYDILLHANDPRAISLMLLQVPERIRRSPAVKRALTLFVALQLQDFHTFFRLFSIASPLEKSLLLKHLPVMWKSSVEMMSKAFGKQDRFPLDEFAIWLKLPDHIEAQVLCNAMNLHMEETQQSETIPSTPKVIESWEEDEAAAAVPPVAPPVGFIRFKIAPLNGEIDRALTQRLLVDMAKRIQQLEIEEQLQSASDLVRRPGLSKTVKQAESA